MLTGKRLAVVEDDAELADLIAAAAARAGASVEVFASGLAFAAALERARAGETFQAAILDIPSPDLGPGELFGACTRAQTPTVVISGVLRGRRSADALRHLGAAAVFEKPFDVQAVIAAVALLAGDPDVPPVENEAVDEVTGSIPLATSTSTPTSTSTSTSTPTPKPTSTTARAGLPGERVRLDPAAPTFGPSPSAGSPSPATDPAAPAQSHLGLPFDAARETAPAPPSPEDALAAPISASRPRPSRAPEPPPPARGELGHAPLPRLLVALHLGQATGALTLARDPVKKILFVEHGTPVYAASNLPAERLAGLAVRRGIITAERLEALRRARPEARTAELLTAEGLLSDAAHRELVALQVRVIAWSCFEWRDGSYAFQLGRPPGGRLPIAVATGDLVLDGLRRTATLPRLRAELPDDVHLAPAPDPAVELYALRLLPQEAHLLTLADGTKSVADLLRLSDLDERATRAFLQAGRLLRLLDAVERVLASTRRIGFM